MRTSRISRETSKVLSAISNRSRPQRTSTRPLSNGSIRAMKAEASSDSELSSVPSDVENEATKSAVLPRKRKRGADTPVTSVTTRIETTSIAIPSTAPSEIANVPLTKDGRPKKGRRQPAKKMKSENGVVIEPPANWERMYTLTREMRNKNPAPVDNMGCETVANIERNPRDRRFQTLIALMLSSQTKDTVTAPTIWNMQKNMPGGFNLESVIALPPADLNAFICKVGFHNIKTKNIKATAEILRDRFSSEIPDTIEGLISLPGVGPKMAYLCMSAAWGRDEGIGVDVHVHRITNLWGWHSTKNPEETRASLEAWLPREKWHDINNLMVGFGQAICLPVGRKCGECLLADEGLCPGAVIAKIKKVKKEEVDLKVEGEGEVEEKKETIEGTGIKLEDVPDAAIADIEDIGRPASPAKRAARRTRK